MAKLPGWSFENKVKWRLAGLMGLGVLLLAVLLAVLLIVVYRGRKEPATELAASNTPGLNSPGTIRTTGSTLTPDNQAASSAPATAVNLTATPQAATAAVPTIVGTATYSPSTGPATALAATSATSPAKPEPTTTPIKFQPVATANAGRPLTPAEKAAAERVAADVGNLQASLERVDELMLYVYPDRPDWNDKLAKELAIWRGMLDYYRANPLNGRTGSLVGPVWLAALARLERAGQTLPAAYRQSDGLQVSRADQEIAYAEVELARTAALLQELRKL